MRPGRPFGFALWDNKPVCVLSGTPAAPFVCFQELVRPAMASLAGKRETSLPRVRALLKCTLRARSECRYFVLARLELAASAFVAIPLQNQCSALVRTAADSNAIIVVPEIPSKTDSRIVAGEMVDVDIFDWPRGRCDHEP
jgi:molybdopterin molybdotransferase